MLGDHLPRACVAPPTLGLAIVKADCVRLRPDSELANSKFVSAGLNSSAVRRQGDDLVHGVGRPRLGLKWFRTLRFPLAPLSEQERLVDAIDSYVTRLDDAVASLERVQTKLKAYRASVLKAAVEGRLVPTEASLAHAEKRTYEPAEALLARILKERRRRWEEAELAKLKAAGKSSKEDKWKAKYQEAVAPDTSTLRELPEGWCWASVDQLGAVVTGTTPPTSNAKLYGGDVPFFKPTDLDAGENVIAARQYLSRAGLDDARLLPAGAVLVTCIGATIGKTGLTRVDCTTNQQINAWISEEPLRRTRYGFWFFVSPMGRNQVVGNASSTTLPILNKSRFLRIHVPVPPEREQVRIVAGIERHTSVADKALSDAALQLRRIHRLRQAVLKWAFEGKLVDQDPTDEPAGKGFARILAMRAAAVPTKESRGQKATGAA